MKYFIVIIALFLSLLWGCSRTPTEKINDLYQTGLENLNSLDFNAAFENFEEILTVDSSSDLAALGKGLVFEYRHQYYDAVAHYLRLNQISPDFLPAYEGAFRIFTHLGYYEDAAEISALLSKKSPDDYNSIIIDGLALYHLNKYQAAINKFKKALDFNPDDTDRVQLLIATSLLASGNKDSAQMVYDEILSNGLRSSEAYEQAADFMEISGFLDSSITLSKKSIELSDTQYLFRLKHFNRVLRTKYFFDARQVIMELNKNGLDSVAYHAMNLFYHLGADNKSQARNAGQKYRHFDIKSLTSLMYDMLARRIISDRFSLRTDYSAIEKRNYDTLYSLRFDEFYKYAAFINYAMVPDFRDLKKMEGFSDFRLSTKQVKLEMAKKRYITRDTANAITELKLHENQYSTEPDWLVGIADIYGHFAVKRFDKAEKLYHKALEFNQWYSPAYSHLIDMLFLKKRYAKSLEISKQYNHLEENNHEIALLNVKILILNKKFDEAISLFNDHYRFVKGRLDYFKEYITLLRRDNRKNDINKIIDLIKDTNSNNSDIITFLAKYYNENNDYQKAIQYSEKALTIEPDNGNAHAELARAKFYSGEKEESIQYFEDNLLTYQEYAPIFTYYSRILAEEKIDNSKAGNTARTAVGLSTSGMEEVINLCYVYTLTGRNDLSLGEVLKVLRFNNDVPELFFYAGRAYYYLKRDNYQANAKESLEKAIALGLQGKLKQEAEALLKNL